MKRFPIALLSAAAMLSSLGVASAHTVRHPANQTHHPLTAVTDFRAVSWGTHSMKVRWRSVPGAVEYRLAALPQEVPGTSSMPPNIMDIRIPAQPGPVQTDTIRYGVAPSTIYQVHIWAGNGRTWGPETRLTTRTWTSWSQIYADVSSSIAETYEQQNNGTGAYNQGTAFLVRGEEDTWLTCAHATDNDTAGPDLVVHLHGHTTVFPAERTAVSFMHDLATISLDYDGIAYPPTMGLPLNTHPLWIGEPIAIIGHPLGAPLIMHTGYLLAIGVPDDVVTGLVTLPYELRGDAWAAAGNSGSPILNPWGQVIGVDDNGSPRGSWSEGIVPITALKYLSPTRTPLPDYPPTAAGNFSQWWKNFF